MKKITSVTMLETKWEMGLRKDPEHIVNGYASVGLDFTIISAGMNFDADGDSVHWMLVAFHDE